MNGARYAYLSRICELIAQGEDIIIVSDDYAAPVLDRFRVDYHERYVSVGIAEQNLISVSCGLALAGKRVIAYGCAPFPITRAFDQIKNAASMMHIPINIVMAGIGFAIPEWGATHYNAEDLSLMRTIPNMRIITPTDNIMGTAAADYALVNTTPVYLRFDKYAEGEIYTGKKIDFHRGFEILRDGGDIVVITCGSFTSRILKLAEQWYKDGVSARIIDLYSLPFNLEALLSEIEDIPILTVEEHILSGGIGSLILETIHESGLTNPIKRMGIVFEGNYPQTSGTREYYINKYGLSDCDIAKAVFSLCTHR
jgi:transketolase